MGSIDDLPQRSPTHALDDKAEDTFRSSIAEAGCFIIQSVDRRDYGSDIQLEAIDGISATNCRVHIQLKGTAAEPNRDGSVSVGPVERSNLNYLLTTPEACYVGYHAPSKRLLVRSVEDVYAAYERDHGNWQKQQTLTIRFQSEPFDQPFQQRLRDKALASHRTDRDARLDWAAVPPEGIRRLVSDARPLIKVPSNMEQAFVILHELYAAGDDRSVSALYQEFKAVLGHARGRMLGAHMAEINLAMNTKHRNEARLLAAIAEIDELIGITKPPVLDLRYTRANCLSALRRDVDAIAEYRKGLEETEHPDYNSIGAKCFKNMGTSLQRTGDPSSAILAYEEALRLDPDLAEARLALAHCHARQQNFAEAVAQLDGVARRRTSALDRNTIQGWRAQYLSLAGHAESALDEILRLASSADEAAWIWPWSANLVARCGRSSPATLMKALQYWRHYLHEHPASRKAQRERLLCLWSLREHKSEEGTEPKPQTCSDGGRKIGYREFRDAAIPLMVGKGDEAFWWDRIGHWAQADGDWTEAEAAYRKAHALEPGDYDYCLGTALNYLRRYEDALPLLKAAASAHNDSQGWHQLGVAHAGREDWPAAIAVYKLAIELDATEPLPWFNLGGAHWNIGDETTARDTWKQAIARFPNHPLAAEAKTFLG